MQQTQLICGPHPTDEIARWIIILFGFFYVCLFFFDCCWKSLGSFGFVGTVLGTFKMKTSIIRNKNMFRVQLSETSGQPSNGIPTTGITICKHVCIILLKLTLLTTQHYIRWLEPFLTGYETFGKWVFFSNGVYQNAALFRLLVPSLVLMSTEMNAASYFMHLFIHLFIFQSRTTLCCVSAVSTTGWRSCSCLIQPDPTLQTEKKNPVPWL